MKSSLSFAILVAMSGVAHASFELALLTTSGSNAIARVDPENRVVLGSFGANRLINPRAIAARSNGSEAFILNSYGNGGSRITVMNYFTGATIREFSVSASGFSSDIELLPNGDVIVISGAILNRYNSSGAFVRSYTGTETFVSVSSSAFYDEVYGHAAGSTRAFIGSTGNSLSSFSSPPVNGGTASQAAGVTIGGNGQTLSRLAHETLSFSSSATFTGMNSITSVGYGHGNTVYAAGFGTAGQSTITTFDTNLNRLSDAWNIPGGGSGITGIAVVIAPEPGTMAALGLGAIAMIRRRRQRRETN